MRTLRSWLLASAKDHHRPPHTPGCGGALFLTASTYERKPLLQSDTRKSAFRDFVFQTCESEAVEVVAWVILREHYHLVVRPEQPDRVSKLINRLHGASSRAWNLEDTTPGRRCLYQYWDTFLWSDGDVISRVNYVHNNRVKHGYVSSPEEWEWSSYRQYLADLEGEHFPPEISRFPAPRSLPNDDF